MASCGESTIDWAEDRGLENSSFSRVDDVVMTISLFCPFSFSCLVHLYSASRLSMGSMSGGIRTSDEHAASIA
jgi:hypothetical protein